MSFWRAMGGALLLACAAFAAQAAKPDPAIYPTPNIYRDPAIAASPSAGYAKVVREYCPGGGRGLIHFLDVDGRAIRIRRTWPTFVELAPGAHRFRMEFKGTASSLWGYWEGVSELSAELEAGKAYIVRYRRDAVDRFSAWLEPLEAVGFSDADVTTSICMQAPFPDTDLHH